MPLSPRQKQIIRRISHGDTDKEIASRLGISEGTINFHVRRILIKLRVKSRAHAVRFFLGFGR